MSPDKPEMTDAEFLSTLKESAPSYFQHGTWKELADRLEAANKKLAMAMEAIDILRRITFKRIDVVCGVEVFGSNELQREIVEFLSKIKEE